MLTLKIAHGIVIPRCLLGDTAQPASTQMVGFCDASMKAYAVIVYLRLESETLVDVKLLAAKTRVALLQGATIQRLELFSVTLIEADHLCSSGYRGRNLTL